MSLELRNAKEGFLGCVHASRAIVVRIAALVVRGRHHPDWGRELVGCVQERLVLIKAVDLQYSPFSPSGLVFHLRCTHSH